MFMKNVHFHLVVRGDRNFKSGMFLQTLIICMHISDMTSQPRSTIQL